MQGEDPVGPQPLSPLGENKVLRAAGYNLAAKGNNEKLRLDDFARSL